MTDAELLDRIRLGEGPLCEFKRSPHSDEIREVVVAFANTVRGADTAVLFLGLMPDGRPSGAITDADKTQRDVRRHLERVYPPVPHVKTQPFRIGDDTVVCVIVPESRVGPHFAGPAFLRVGSENLIASPEKFEELIADRTEAARLLRRWLGAKIQVVREAEPVPGRRRWPDSPSLISLMHIDAVGLRLQTDGGTEIAADWSRVKLQPSVSGQPPLIRISIE